MLLSFLTPDNPDFTLGTISVLQIRVAIPSEILPAYIFKSPFTAKQHKIVESGR